MATIEEMLVRVQTSLSMAAGINVQTHAEDRLINTIRKAYNFMFDMQWWDEFLIVETFTLDGSTGMITGDVSAKIGRFIDIHSIYYENDSHQIPRLSSSENPLSLYDRRIAPVNSATKRFRVYPITTTGDVTVRYRTRITDATWDDVSAFSTTEINMDDMLVELFACANELGTDGTNDVAMKMFQQQLDARIKQLNRLENQQPISKSGGQYGVPTMWEYSDHG